VAEVNDAMQASYECPDCHRIHDEPAGAELGFLVRCLDCELELRYDERPVRPELPEAA
jgi:hypothetical protein